MSRISKYTKEFGSVHDLSQFARVLFKILNVAGQFQFNTWSRWVNFEIRDHVLEINRNLKYTEWTY